MLRILAALRDRRAEQQSEQLLKLYWNRAAVKRELRELRRERYSLLDKLKEHEGEILHPHNLLVDVWQYHDSAGASTLVRAHVSNLRKKLRAVHGSAEQIQTIRCKGYRYSA